MAILGEVLDPTAFFKELLLGSLLGDVPGLCEEFFDAHRGEFLGTVLRCLVAIPEWERREAERSCMPLQASTPRQIQRS
jgi:hypothetical protein